MTNNEQVPCSKHSVRRVILLFLLALALACLVPLFYLLCRPPLLRTHDRSVFYSIADVPHEDAEVFQPLFLRGFYYVRLPALTGQRYEWFLVNYNSQRVQRPYWPEPGIFGLFQIHGDQVFGLDLTQQKMEDTWRLSFTHDHVEFSNDTIHVRVTQNGA